MKKSMKRSLLAIAAIVILAVVGCVCAVNLQQKPEPAPAVDVQPEAVEPAPAADPYAVGSYVTFGAYQQTAGSKEKRPIEWQVLERDGNKALLISRYSLEEKKYNSSKADTTWETCSLRAWLNGTFCKQAFTDEQLAAILTTTVDNSKAQCNSNWLGESGQDTQDKLFLLSYAEASKLEERRCVPTDYSMRNYAPAFNGDERAKLDGKDTSHWWLRSPGHNGYDAAYVDSIGAIYNSSVDVASGVRPVMWVDLEAAAFN